MGKYEPELSDLRAQLRAMLATVRREGRDFNAAENVEWDRVSDRLDALSGERDRELDAALENAARRDDDFDYASEHGSGGRRRTSPNPIGSPLGAGEFLRDPLSGDPRSTRGTFSAMFGQPQRDPVWRNDLGHFIRDVARARQHGVSPRLQNSINPMTEGEGPSAGYLVPWELTAGILDASFKAEVVRPRARIYPMRSRTMRLTFPDNTDRSAGTANLALQWIGEASNGTDQKAKYRTCDLFAHKAAIYVSASLELIEDVVEFPQYIADLFAAEFARGFDNTFIHGTGAGQPMGIMNATSRVTVSKETSQASATLVSANVFKMWSRLAPYLHADAVWMVHPSVLPQLYQLALEVKDVTGTTTHGGAPIFMPSTSGIAAEPAGTLLGRPLIICDACHPLGTEGDIILAALSQYAIGLRREMTLDVSNAPGWQSGEIAFRMIARIDGAPAWQKAMTPVKGSDTLSWCVTLQAR